MICDCTIKENSFVGPYDVMFVLQYSLITSSVSIIVHNYLQLSFPSFTLCWAKSLKKKGTALKLR